MLYSYIPIAIILAAFSWGNTMMVRHAARYAGSYPYACATALAVLVSVSNTAAAEQADDAAIEQIVVTGTHIRGTAPVGTRLVTLTQEEIQAAGFTRIEEVLRSLPQNFGGGPREDTYVQQGFADRATGTNANKGAAINLRGLGAGTTLILVNGRRLSPGGTTGLFTDVSNLPLAAIERIEVLTDGASALYGSDAIGGVINVITRRDYRGAQTSVRAVAGAGNTFDYHLSQAVGAAWNAGSVNVSYEFMNRDGLLARSRPFSANIDQRGRGGDDFRTPGGNPGVIVIGDQMWAIPANQNGQGLTPDSFVEGTVNYRNESDFLWLLPAQKRHGLTVGVSQDIGERVTFWAQGVAGRRDNEAQIPWYETLTVPASNPFYVNPTGGTDDIRVRYDMTEDLGGVSSRARVDIFNVIVGADTRIGRDWRLTTDVAYGEERSSRQGGGVDRTALAAALADPDPETAFNPFGDGAYTNPATIDTIRAGSLTDAVSDLQAINVLAEGPVLTWAAGDIRLAVGAEDRAYSYDTESRSYGATPTVTTSSDSRRLNAFFTELRVPVVGDGNRLPGIHSLTFSASLRREQYSDFGRSTVPKYGLSWSPVESVTLRATWSESFRAPDLASLNETNNGFTLVNRPDPQSPTGSSRVLVWSGGNAALLPETADSLTVGLDFRLPRVAGLEVGVSYFDIKYVNRIQSPFTGATLADQLGNPHYSRFVDRDPSQAYREQVCSSGSPTAANQEACLTESIAAIIDSRIANTAKLNTDGIDLEVRYRGDTSFGTFGLGLLATRILNYEQATTESIPPVSLLNRKYRPVDTRMRVNGSWGRGDWVTNVFVNYVADYEDVSDSGTRRVGSWTTMDFDVAYFPESVRGWLSGTSLSLNVQNVLDRDPPFVNTMFGYDITNANPYGRVVSLLARKQW